MALASSRLRHSLPYLAPKALDLRVISEARPVGVIDGRAEELTTTIERNAR